MFLFQYVLYLSLKHDLLTLKEYKQLLVAFREIQDGDPKEIMRGKFKFRFSK